MKRMVVSAFCLSVVLLVLTAAVKYPYHSQKTVSFAPGSAISEDYGITNVLDRQQTSNGMIVLAQNQENDTLCFEINQFLWLPFYQVSMVDTLQKDTFRSAMTDDFSVCAYEIADKKIIISEESKRNGFHWIQHLLFLMIAWNVILWLLRKLAQKQQHTKTPA